MNLLVLYLNWCYTYLGVIQKNAYIICNTFLYKIKKKNHFKCDSLSPSIGTMFMYADF